MVQSASARSIRVLVVDDAPPYLEAARALIGATPGFEWIGEASCGEDAIELVDRIRPDLVLMDLHMPGIGGIEAAHRIASRAIPTTVILITSDELADAVPHATGAGPFPKHRLKPASLRRLWEENKGLELTP